MAPMVSFLLFFSSLAFLSIGRAQERAPHGLVYENPMAFSPSAVDFFHPKTEQAGVKNPCAESGCSPLPLAAEVEAAQVHESKLRAHRSGSGSRVGAGGIAGVVFGFVLAVLLAMGVYHVVITRRNNMNRANSVRPDA